MNIKIKDDSSEILEKFCRNTSQTPSKVIESLIDVLYPVYLDYEKRRDAEIEKRSFNQVLSDLLRHISNSTVENLDVAPKLIETTNRVLGIKNYIGASIFDIQLDFDKRSISYFVGYRSCTNLNYAFTALAISVEINQDHIQISELVYEPILESQEITDIELREIEGLYTASHRMHAQQRTTAFCQCVGASISDGFSSFRSKI